MHWNLYTRMPIHIVPLGMLISAFLQLKIVNISWVVFKLLEFIFIQIIMTKIRILLFASYDKQYVIQ
jgi:hypothetical protein